MVKPRIFLGSSGKQAKLLQALTRGLEDVADVEPWTTTFNPGTTTLGRLVELTREVDFAAFVFAQDDWTSAEAATPDAEASAAGQASPRDNVVFEAGLFGGVLGMERTFILHANGAKLPTDLLGLTSVRYGDATKAAEVKAVNQKLRKAIEDIGGLSRIEGLWWQFSITERDTLEPSAVSLLRISRDREHMLEVNGRAWQEDGTLSSRYSSEAAKEMKDPAGIFYLWTGRAPAPPERTADLRHRRDQARDRGPRLRFLDHPVRRRFHPQRPDIRRLPTRRGRRPCDPGRTGQPGPSGTDHRADRGLEVHRERLTTGAFLYWPSCRRTSAALRPDHEVPLLVRGCRPQADWWAWTLSMKRYRSACAC